jgi:ubiquinone biosynthesis protein UbiJ
MNALDHGGQGRAGAYNPCMFHTLTASLQAALAERLALLLNHVLAAEPVATERLRAHSGCSLQLQLDGWPALLPALPELAFRVTPAGLLEWCGLEPLAHHDLRLRLDASNPALAMALWAAGERPRVDVQGDARFAAELSWLIDNLRWDVQDDLARLVGEAPAHEIARVGQLLAGGLREAVRTLSGWAARADEPGSGPR